MRAAAVAATVLEIRNLPEFLRAALVVAVPVAEAAFRALTLKPEQQTLAAVVVVVVMIPVVSAMEPVAQAARVLL
jgi:hypothetical protein